MTGNSQGVLLFFVTMNAFQRLFFRRLMLSAKLGKAAGLPRSAELGMIFLKSSLISDTRTKQLDIEILDVYGANV